MPNIVVSTSGSGQTTGPSGSYLVDQISAIIGGVDETNARMQSLACLNRIRTRLNKREWHWTKTTHANITLVNATQTYALPTAFDKASFARLMDVSTSKPYLDLIYKDDNDFAHWLEPQTDTGPPQYYTLRNTFADGLISVFPIPDSSTAAKYSLQIEYYGRIAVFVDDSASRSDFPEAVSDVLISGAQWCLLHERDRGNMESVNAKRSEYLDDLGLLIAWDRRQVDEKSRFTLGKQRSTLGTMYIKVS